MSDKFNDGPQIPTPIMDGVVEMNSEARNWAMFAHLAALAGYVLPVAGNIIGPLVVWMIKKDEFPYVDAHGKEALNFQISVTIYLLVSSLFCLFGIPLLIVVPIFSLIFMIIAAINAAAGKQYRYPLTIRFVN
jgi:uncharacterized protein